MAADQRNLKTKASIADMATELENDWWEKVRKLSQAHDVSAKMDYASLMRTVKLTKKSARWVKKLFSLEMKKELKIQNVATITGFFYAVFRKLSGHTSYIILCRYLSQRSVLRSGSYLSDGQQATDMLLLVTPSVRYCQPLVSSSGQRTVSLVQIGKRW